MHFSFLHENIYFFFGAFCQPVEDAVFYQRFDYLLVTPIDTQISISVCVMNLHIILTEIVPNLSLIGTSHVCLVVACVQLHLRVPVVSISETAFQSVVEDVGAPVVRKVLCFSVLAPYGCVCCFIAGVHGVLCFVFLL